MSLVATTTQAMSSNQGKLALTRSRPWAVRIFRGSLRRIVTQTRVVIWCAPPKDCVPAYPEGCVLARVAGAAPADQDLAKEAMRAAGEPNGLVGPRLAHDDEFFGWLLDGRVVSFGWVTCQDRTVGPFKLAEAPGRAFLYNFHTLDGYRGQRLYPALLLAIRHVLGREKVAEFVIDVNSHNTASARGIEEGGFIPAAQVAFLTLFSHWRCLGSRTVVERATSSLFRTV